MDENAKPEPIDSRLIERPYDPARKRYYMVDTQWGKITGDWEIVNLEAFRQENGGSPLIYNHKSIEPEVKVFAGKCEDGYDCYYQGPLRILRNLPEKPVIKVGIRNKLMDVYGSVRSPFISNRAKHFFESIDPEAFEFLECDAFTRNKVKLEPYWRMNVIGLVMDFDEEQSVFREFGGGFRPIPAGRRACITDLYEATMLPELTENKHAFWLLKYTMHYIFDEVLVDAWRKEKFIGLEFSPLQPPSKKELNNAYKYVNSDYFYEYGRKYWKDLI